MFYVIFTRALSPDVNHIPRARSPAKPARAAARPKSGTVAKSARETSSDVPARGTSDVDSIPTTNPEAPRHDGEWYWLMKAEPETRLENGIDVSFSIDHLRARTKPEGWDGNCFPLSHPPFKSKPLFVILTSLARHPRVRRYFCSPLPLRGAQPGQSFTHSPDAPVVVSAAELLINPLGKCAARNHMRNMNAGDKAFFYHSNCKEPGIVGIMEIVKEFSEDGTAPSPLLLFSMFVVGPNGSSVGSRARNTVLRS